MDLLQNLAIGLSAALSLQNLIYCFAGVFLGTLIGVLPGLGPVATIAMLLPATYTLPPTAALIMLAGIYYGSQYGGSTTAILINIPGESSSVVTAIDGYQMARRGRAGVALFTAGMGSFIAGCIGVLILAAFAVPLAEVAFDFGPTEYSSLMTLGLVGATVLSSGSLLKATGMVIVGLLLGISSISVPWDTLFTSVVLYIVIPVLIAQAWRRLLLARGEAQFQRALAAIGPYSIAALLLTLVLLFAFQGEAILRQPLIIAMLAVPILIQVFFNSALAYWLNRAVGEKHNIACPSALIGASNFFELAVAAAISLFGFNSGAALATVVGVLIEVPVMLAVVKVVNSTRGWYGRGV